MWYSQNNRSKRIRNTYNRKSHTPSYTFRSSVLFSFQLLFESRAPFECDFRSLLSSIFFLSLRVSVRSNSNRGTTPRKKDENERKKDTHCSIRLKHTHWRTHTSARSLSFSDEKVQAIVYAMFEHTVESLYTSRYVPHFLNGCTRITQFDCIGRHLIVFEGSQFFFFHFSCSLFRSFVLWWDRFIWRLYLSLYVYAIYVVRRFRYACILYGECVSIYLICAHHQFSN